MSKSSFVVRRTALVGGFGVLVAGGAALLRPSLAAALAVPPAVSADTASARRPARGSTARCAADDGGLALAPGLCATVFASGVGAPRHVTVSPTGDVFVALYDRAGGGVLALRDSDGDGVADVSKRFGPGRGNGIVWADGFLYFATDAEVVRWKLAPGELTPAGEPTTIVRDLPVSGNHVSKSVAVRGSDLYVSIGSATNSCQVEDRKKGSPGADPCRETDTRAGIWRFSASRAGQTQADGTRFATGIRNAVGLAIDPQSGLLYAVSHGRDQLSANWGFSDEANAETPGEEFLQLEQGDDFGWPYCYVDRDLRTKVLAPEYGGDGHAVGRCASAKAPVRAYPAHWGPNALAFARAQRASVATRSGAFIAFHGSWNRAPLPQAGYRVIFQPMRNGAAAGDYVTIATLKDEPAGLRASGVAMDERARALYIAADRNGKVWRVVRK
jgi:glucose/arabinose dehydrogenase